MLTTLIIKITKSDQSLLQVLSLYFQDETLEDVRMDIRSENETPHRRLRFAMEQVVRGIDNYLKLAGSFSTGAGSGKTKLDKHRQQTCKAAMVRNVLKKKTVVN